MKWVSKTHLFIDGIACPWLIKRFIDTEAEFLFVTKELVNKTAKEEGALAYGSLGESLSPINNQCNFITILKKYKIDDPALWKLSELINAAETENFKSHAYAGCLHAISQGFSMLFPDNLENVEQQFIVYDALYNFFRLITKQEEKVKPRKKDSPKLF